MLIFALEWTLDRFLVPSAPNPPFTLIVVHSKPNATSSMNFPIPGNLRRSISMNGNYLFCMHVLVQFLNMMKL